MSNKMLLALLVVGVVVVGGVALNNKTNETTTIEATEVDENCPVPESTVDGILSDVVPVETDVMIETKTLIEDDAQ